MDRDLFASGTPRAAYDLVLDLYPLLDCHPDSESSALADSLRCVSVSLVLMLAKEPDADIDRCLLELRILVRLALDLGYLEDDVCRFLEKKIAAITPSPGVCPLPAKDS